MEGRTREVRLEPLHLYLALQELDRGDVLRVKIPHDASKLIPARELYFKVEEAIPGGSAALRYFLGWTGRTAVRGYLVDREGRKHIPAVLKVHFTPVEDEMRKLLLAGVELYSVERRIRKDAGPDRGRKSLWERLVHGLRPATRVRASVQMYVPEGDKTTFLGELARSAAIPEMARRPFARIADQTQDNIGLVARDGDVLPEGVLRESEAFRTVSGKHDISDVLKEVVRSDLRLRIADKLFGVPVGELVCRLPRHLLGRERGRRAMVEATRRYVEYLLRGRKGKVTGNVRQKLRAIERVPRAPGLAAKKKVDRRTAELWNWLILHHEARTGAAKAVLSRYLRALKGSAR